MKLVRLEHCPPQPWKNGGGTTRELLVWSDSSPSSSPAQSNAGEHAAYSHPGPGWDLRVSVADITRDGPFSEYPGIDRCFAVLEGAGVELELDAQPHRLDPGSDPLRFQGEAPLPCRLLSGPTRDLNLMGRRSAGVIDMRRARPHETLSSGRRWRGLYVVQAARADFGSGPQQLPADTLFWMASPTTAWTFIEGEQALWLTQDDR